MQLFQAGPEHRKESAEIEKREHQKIAMPNESMDWQFQHSNFLCFRGSSLGVWT